MLGQQKKGDHTCGHRGRTLLKVYMAKEEMGHLRYGVGCTWGMGWGAPGVWGGVHLGDGVGCTWGMGWGDSFTHHGQHVVLKQM